MRPDGTIETYKVRLMTKSFSQNEDIEFFNIYTPLCRVTAIRMLIEWVAIKKFIIHQMDMNTAFLNGDLTEKI